jgi:hypothetical protein
MQEHHQEFFAISKTKIVLISAMTSRHAAFGVSSPPEIPDRLETVPQRPKVFVSKKLVSQFLQEFRGPEIQPNDITIICRIGVDPESQANKGTQSTVYKAFCYGTEVCVKGFVASFFISSCDQRFKNFVCRKKGAALHRLRTLNKKFRFFPK